MKTVAFGPFLLSKQNRCLYRDGLPVVIGFRALEILAVLIEHHGELVSKGTLKAAVWPDVEVAEVNLWVQMSALRRALGKASDGQQYIHTVSGRGYRFVAPIEMTVETPLAAERVVEEEVRLPHHLPRPFTRLIGRESDVAAVARELQQARLVSIVGFGGIGKTRIALEVGERCFAAFPHGVWFVELAAETDAGAVPERIAAALQVDSCGTAALEQLAHRLADRRLLLIIDNCEHLIAAAAQTIAHLLRHCPNLVILTTSREALAIAGEIVFPISPLSVPPRSSDPMTLEVLKGFSSVELLLERMHAASRKFSLSDIDPGQIIDICRRLDGIPLAIELAAARLPAFGASDLLKLLDRRFAVLTRGERTVLPRHQTLYAMMEWSHGLLTPSERVALRRLAIFSGGWTLEAAEVVIADDDLPVGAVADRLASLLDKSLVMAQPTPAGIRYQMLETVRIYAHEKLVTAGEAERLSRAHATYFRNLFFRKYGRRPVPADDVWLRRHQQDIDNVRAALDWALGPEGDPALGIVLAPCARYLWDWLELREELAEYLLQATRFLGPAVPAIDRARLLGHFATRCPRSERHRAHEIIDQALELYRDLGDVSWLSSGLITKALIAASRARFDEAKAALCEMQDLLTDEDPYICSIGFLNRAVVFSIEGKHVEAAPLLEQALDFSRLAGCKLVEAQVLGNLADCLLQAGRVAEAATMARAAVTLLRQIGRRGGIGFALGNLAACLLEQGNLDEAYAAAGEALSMLRDTGWIYWLLDHLALILALQGAEELGARISGQSGKLYAERHQRREPNEQRSHERLMAVLARRCNPERLAALLAEGAAWNQLQAVSMALSAAPLSHAV